MNYETIKSHFTVKSQNKNSCMALCPCHNDKKASLSISYDAGSRRTLIYCHAGCHIKDILGRAGLKMSDLFEEDTSRRTRQDRIEAVYKYTDEEGKLLFEKVRFKPKAFSQRRYIDGCMVWGLGAGRYYETYPGNNNYSMKEREGARTKDFPGTSPVLYNLPSVIKAVDGKKTIYFVEGEKDADNLIKLGLTATTNFDGASKSLNRHKWKKEYNKYLKGAEVVLLPDNDISGRHHMLNIAKELKGTARSIKVVELPVPDKEDVTWYLEEGHTWEELLNLIKNTVYGGECTKGENFSLLNYHFSDVAMQKE